MQALNITWPTPAEYDWAMQNRHTTFYDPDIQHGPLKEIGGRPARLNGGGSRYVCVYLVGNWVVRCFTAQPPQVAPPAGLYERYRAITHYLHRVCSSPELAFLTPHLWVERGANVKGDDLPFVKVPYLAGSQPLGDFLVNHYHDQQVMQLLAQQWLGIGRQMEVWQIAHGDLDMSNILVCGTFPNLVLRLIDFDGMYVPELAGAGLGVADAGHTHFQPTQPGIRTFSPQMDRFSALIIYITLCAVRENPALWENCDADETRPLLGAEDFVRLGLSKNFTRLLQERHNNELQQCLQELQNSIMQARMPHSLADILGGSGSPYARKEGDQGAVGVITEAPYEGRSLVVPAESEPTTTLPPTVPLTPQITPSAPSPDVVPPTLQPAASSGNAGHSKRVVIATIVIVIIVLAGLLIWWLAYQSQQQQPTHVFVALQALSSLLPWQAGKGGHDG
jgi:hypothetical protein